MPNNCAACGSNTLDTKGFGTEQIELELKEIFPNHNIGRMDLEYYSWKTWVSKNNRCI